MDNLMSFWFAIVLLGLTCSGLEEHEKSDQQLNNEALRPKRQVTQLVYQVQQFQFTFPFNWPFTTIPQLIQPINISSQIVAAVPENNPSIENAIAKQNSYSCGKASVYRESSWPTTRIIDGSYTAYGEFPWLVAIMSDNGYRHVCGGSLINNQYILTAAHCFSNIKQQHEVQSLRVLVGDYNIYSPNDAGQQVRSVSRLIKHGKWNSPGANFNDVALLKLDRPVQFNQYVQPVCLASGNQASFYSAGTLATAAGWGAVQGASSSGPKQSVPLKIVVPLIDNNSCRNSLYPHQIADSMICAGENRKSTCLNLLLVIEIGAHLERDAYSNIQSWYTFIAFYHQALIDLEKLYFQGDSGGPLQQKSVTDGRWYIIGLTSWGLGCSGYGVFTRISSFRSWIDKYSSS